MPTTVTKPCDKCPVYVERTVIEQIKKYGAVNRQCEVCGVLLGNLCLTPDNEWIVVVDRIVLGKHAEHSQGSVTFTELTWKYIDEKMDKYYPHKTIVGWFHTHPSFGIFFSQDDLLVHRMGFRNEWQVAYVYDPVRNEDGWFLWDKEKKEPCLSNDVHFIDVPQTLENKNGKTTDKTTIYQIAEESKDDTFKTQETTARAYSMKPNFQSDENWNARNASFSLGDFIRSETMKTLIFSCVSFLLFMFVFVFAFAGHFQHKRINYSLDDANKRIEKLESWSKYVANSDAHNQEIEDKATKKELDDKLATKTDKTDFEALKAKVDQEPDVNSIQEEQTKLRSELDVKATNEYVDKKTAEIDDKLTKFEEGIENRFAKIEDSYYVKKGLNLDQKNDKSKNKGDIKPEAKAEESGDEKNNEDFDANAEQKGLF